MGLNKSNNTQNAVYCFQGKMITPANKSETTIEKNGKYYEPYNSISGIIREIETVKGYAEGEQDLKVVLEDAGVLYSLVFGVNSSYFKSFSKMFPNLDVTNTVEIFATFKEEDGKKKTGIVMQQDGVWIKRAFTYENMGKCPQALPVEVNGKVNYDYTEQNAFLLKNINSIFAKKKLPF